MHLQRLSADRPAVCRFSENRWIPDHCDLDAAVEDHELADGVDVDNELALAFSETLVSRRYATG
jgi:hypothetical protein